MMEMVSVSRRLGADRAELFRLWTEVDGLVRWIGPAVWQPFAEVDLRVGGPYRMGMVVPQVGEICATGQFTEIQPDERLVLTWHWEGTDEPVTTVRVEFVPVEGGTEVRLVHTGFTTEEEVQNHIQGWTDWLNRLEKIVPY